MAHDRPVEIVDYDPQWPPLFDDLRVVIGRAVGDLALAIEHVGSTAVGGLAAKPIIDMDVVIASRQQLPQTIAALAALGYRHQGDLGIKGREAFAREGPEVPRDGAGREWPEHHLYVCPSDSPELHRHLVFRDWLRTHPAAADAYGELKRDLARRFRHDREAYCNGKSQFVENVLRE